MKNLILICLLFCLGHFSCVGQSITFSGIIHDFDPTVSDTIIRFCTMSFVSGQQECVLLPVDEEGRFTGSMDIVEANELLLGYKQKWSAYPIYPGQEVFF